MKKDDLIFLDTETTGIGPRDRLTQCAYWYQGEEYNSLFKPPVEISVDSMVIAHITNEMVADKDPFVGSEMQQHLTELFASGGILVAHNAPFDQGMLEKEGMDNISLAIDTRKVARELDSAFALPKYGLQFLRYSFKLEPEGDVVAHDALGDVRVLKALFDKQFAEMLETLQSEEAVLAEMIEISKRPVLHRTIPFGKYKDDLVSEVAQRDPGYLEWLLGAKKEARDEKGEDDDGWIYTLEHYLSERSR